MTQTKEPIPSQSVALADASTWRFSDLIVILAIEYLLWSLGGWLRGGVDNSANQVLRVAVEAATELVPAAFIVASSAWIATTEHNGLGALRLSFKASPRILFQGVAGGMALAIVGGIGEQISQSMLGGDGSPPMDITGTTPWVALLSLVLLPAVSEEMYFRGLVYVTVSTRTGSRLLGALTASGLFALMHGYDASGAVAMLTVALLLTVLVEYSGLLTAMIAHATCNGIVTILLFQGLT